MCWGFETFEMLGGEGGRRGLEFECFEEFCVASAVFIVLASRISSVGLRPCISRAKARAVS